MKISKEYPPNYALIIEKLGNVDGSLFCYGDTIYNPFERDVTEDLVQHEAIHSRQQGDAPDVWYYQYLSDPQFRLQQEIEAYGTQYAFAKRYIKGGKFLEWALDNMARALSGPMYGNLVTHNQAVCSIKLYAKKVIYSNHG